MGFIGLIRLLALVFAGWLLWRFAQRKRIQNDKTSDKSLNQPMVACKHCGVHVPKADAVQYKEHWYCSTEHQQLDQDNN